MRQLPTGMAEAFQGSSSDATIQFNVWYDGNLVAPDIAVGAWTMEWDASRQVPCQTSATILDDDGSLTPWDIDDALGTGGSILQSKVLTGGLSCGVGWQTITDASPEETWRLVAGETVWVPGGASIPIKAEDRTEGVIAYRFMAPERPTTGNTALAEIRRLCDGTMDVIVEADVVDGPVSSSIIYKEERMDAVEDLIFSLGAEYRVTGDGQLYIYIPTTTPVWDTKGGSEGEVIRVQRELTLTSRYNAVVSRNTAANGTELQGISKEESGAARFGGPMGRRPMFHAASFAQTQTAVNSDAATTLANRRNKATALLPVRTIFNPAIELGDWITVNMPLPDGSTAPINGKVIYIQWSGSGTVPVGMDLKLECSATDIRTASAKVRGSRWLGQ